MGRRRSFGKGSFSIKLLFLIKFSSQGLSVSAGSEKRKTFSGNRTVLKSQEYLGAVVCKAFKKCFRNSPKTLTYVSRDN